MDSIIIIAYCNRYALHCKVLHHRHLIPPVVVPDARVAGAEPAGRLRLPTARPTMTAKECTESDGVPFADEQQRPDEERWEYHGEVSVASFRTPYTYCELDAVADGLSGKVKTYPVNDDGTVPLAFDVETDDEQARLGGILNLTAEQTEHLAYDLLEQVEAARLQLEDQHDDE